MRKHLSLFVGFGLAVTSFGCDDGAVDDATAVETKQSAVQDSELAPTGRGIGTMNKFQNPSGNQNSGGNGKPGGSGLSENGIFFHGGPVMLGTVNIYYIWYGNWGTNTAAQILPDLAGSLGGSPYYNINSTYTSGAGVHLSNSVAYGGATTSTLTLGNSLSDSQIQSIVSNAITTGALPGDTNGVYFVLTSSEVTASSGFCTQYCGWHTHATIGGADIKYAFIGNPDRCPSSCAAQTVSPNGNAGADGMASIIAHELEEAASDPDLNAWYDRRGYENADKCAWTFGTTYTADGGGLANMKLGSRDFLIQRNWVNASGGFCAAGI